MLPWPGQRVAAKPYVPGMISPAHQFSSQSMQALPALASPVGRCWLLAFPSHLVWVMKEPYRGTNGRFSPPWLHQKEVLHALVLEMFKKRSTCHLV